MSTMEQTPNFKLPDKDFAKILITDTNPVRALKWGLEYLVINGFSITDAPETATRCFNLSETLVGDLQPNKMNYVEMPITKIKYHLINLVDSRQVLADAHAWFDLNNCSTMEAGDIVAIVINRARSYIKLIS